MYGELNLSDNENSIDANIVSNKKLYVGQIDERGLINSFDRQGITINKALFELIGNSIDSNASNIEIKIYNKINCKFIRIIDNGCGMNENDLFKAFNMCGENHRNEKKIGVSGVGLKISTKCISNNTNVYIYTKAVNKNLYKAVIPWKEIIEKGRWTGNINIEKCNDRITKNLYKKMVKNNTGTCIEFEYSENLKNNILSQFIDEERYKINKNERIDYIFGSYNVNISCNYINDWNNDNYILKLYNPFSLDETNYLYNKTYKIDCFINKTNKKIQFAKKSIDNNYECFECTNKNIKRKISIKKFNNIKFKLIGSLKLNICCFKLNNNLLDIDELFELNNTNNYIKNFYGNNVELFNNYNDDLVLKRNNAIISDIIINKKKYGDKKSKFLSKNILMELEYNTYSSQTNIFDNIIGIQGNKHQYVVNEKNLETLLRLCKYIKSDAIDDINNKLMKQNIENKYSEESKYCENNNIKNNIERNTKEQIQDIYINEYNEYNEYKKVEEKNLNTELEIKNLETKEFIKLLKKEFKNKNMMSGNYYKYGEICNNLINKIFEKDEGIIYL